jgi:hypothetical protein
LEVESCRLNVEKISSTHGYESKKNLKKKKKKPKFIENKKREEKTYLRLLPAKLSMKGERREHMKTLR